MHSEVFIDVIKHFMSEIPEPIPPVPEELILKMID